MAAGRQSSGEESLDMDSDDERLLCGFSRCTPRWLQLFHTSRWLLFVLAASAFVQSFVVNGIFPVGLSSLERQFHMSSTQTGIISSWYDFAVLLSVFPVCHWGSRAHKGRWIGLGTLLMALGSFVCALPHYLESYEAGAPSTNSSDYGQCMDRPSEKLDQCKKDEGGMWTNKYFWLFLLGQSLHGVGATPLFSLGTAFIDENVSQKASPVYLAIHAVVQSIGPVIGMISGGLVLGFVYVDVDRDLRTSIRDSDDPRWIGAWWIGFLGSAVAAFLIAFPTLGFARELPEAKRHRTKDVNQCHAVSQLDDRDIILQGHLEDLPRAIWNILRNPTFVATIAIGIAEAMIINGFAAFMPKILEAVLSTTPSIASYLSSTIVLASAVGVMLGGIVIRQLKLQVGGMLKLILVCHVSALLLISSFLIQCPPRNFIGINTEYHDSAGKSLNSSCNAQCSCIKSDWSPVCHRSSDDIYFSACFAGCTSKMGNVWSNCSCLPTVSDELVEGFCSKECGWPMWVFLFVLFLSVVASFSAGIPAQQIMLRVVPFQQRTLGFIPGGILFGAMIDRSCLQWKTNCGKAQSCLTYDPKRLCWTIMAVAVVCKLLAILATVLGYITYRPTDLDNGNSVQTTDSRGPLSVTVNDDRDRLPPLDNTSGKPR